MTEDSLDTDRRYHVKVVLLGSAGSGKTCLVTRLMEGIFTGNETASVGCAFMAKSFHIKDVEICLGIWDTCGQERYESLMRIYYQNAAVAIVCHDLTVKTSYDKTSFWIKELRENTKESCEIYLVGTKLDLVEDETRSRVVDSEEVEKFAKEVGARVFETSSKTGHNIDELFQSVAEDYFNFGLNKMKARPKSIKLHEKQPEEMKDASTKSRCSCARGGDTSVVNS
ncbi:Ras-related protein Rab-24 [Holothuria leucospilota]|uniref:Ras-related protein Rab-24 n=1 Tax=Holothuria leucospilota TaxID=206669 RepID=A0A9Q0YS53_HOLLE|nr:Ras-related protein Rab-24 [Holothuria leucospilota]